MSTNSDIKCPKCYPRGFNFENNFKKNTTENFQVPQAFLKKPLEQEKYKNFLVNQI